jgi:hypothetical protein
MKISINLLNDENLKPTVDDNNGIAKLLIENIF